MSADPIIVFDTVVVLSELAERLYHRARMLDGDSDLDYAANARAEVVRAVADEVKELADALKQASNKLPWVRFQPEG